MVMVVPRTFRPAPPSFPTPMSTQSKLDMRPQKPVEKARSCPRFRTRPSRTRKFAMPSRFAYTRTTMSILSASSNCGRTYSLILMRSSSASCSPPWARRVRYLSRNYSVSVQLYGLWVGVMSGWLIPKNHRRRHQSTPIQRVSVPKS